MDVQTLPELRNFTPRTAQFYVMQFNEKKNFVFHFLKRALKFSLQEWKRKETKMAEEYCICV